MSSQYGELRPTNVWDLLASLGHPSKFQRVLRLGFVNYCTDVAQRKSTKLCTMFDHLLGWYTIYTFWGLLPSNEILLGAKFTLRQILAFFYIGRVTARHSSSGRQPNCACIFTRQGGHSVRHWAVELSSCHLFYFWCQNNLLNFFLNDTIQLLLTGDNSVGWVVEINTFIDQYRIRNIHFGSSLF